ncbi:MAG: MATE family efflux transporter [Cellvibrio sp.]|nr:MATE family efflux transporter [Cellvibrio sp.]
MSTIFTEWKILTRMGAPILLAQLAQMANGVIDTIMAGHASAKDLAGVGIGSSIWIPVLFFFAGILSALQPNISEFKGANKLTLIMPCLWQGIYIAIVSSLLMIIILVNIDPILVLLKLDTETFAIAQGYLVAFSWGVPAMLLLLALRGLTDGMGFTSIFMSFSILTSLFNLPLNYAFIYGFDSGLFEIPALGGIGCGWATSLANWLAFLLCLIYLHWNSVFRQFHLFHQRTKPHWQEIKKLLHLGLPIGTAIFVEVSMFCMIALFLAPLGATTVAAHQIVLNATSVLFMLALSLGMALTLRISYLIGSEQPHIARQLARSSILLAILIACFNVPILFFGRDVIAATYTNDEVVKDIARHLILFAAIFQIADVVQVTMVHVLRGFKDTKIPMLIMILAFWGICLPLGYSLTFTDWIIPATGASGFWIALIVGLSCAACLLTWRVMKRA